MPPQTAKPEVLQRLKEFCLRDEPEYANVAELGTADEVTAALDVLLPQADISTASKALCVAGLVGTTESRKMVKEAAKATDPSMRIAAVVAAQHLPKQQAQRMLQDLAGDPEPSVVELAKMILNTISAGGAAQPPATPAASVTPAAAFPVAGAGTSGQGILLDDAAFSGGALRAAPGQALTGDLVAVLSDEQVQDQAGGQAGAGEGAFG